jgi:SOS-response transcriptional repressor LexA
MKKVGEYLKEKREAKEMSLREAAAAAGISHVNVKEIEDGKTAPSFDRVMKMIRVYHADVQDFLQSTGFLPPNIEAAPAGQVRQIPIVSWVIAGKWEEICDAFQPGDADEWIESEMKAPNIFALRVKGDSMEPEFQEDDIIIVKPHVKGEHNDYVVVKNEDDEATFKQLKKYGKARILHPLNPKYPDIELSDKVQYKIVGKVVEKIKRKRY